MKIMNIVIGIYNAYHIENKNQQEYNPVIGRIVCKYFFRHIGIPSKYQIKTTKILAYMPDGTE